MKNYKYHFNFVRDMVLFNQGVKAKCRKCGNEAAASDFRMHYDYKMMVCPNCFKGEKEKIKVQNTTVPKEEPLVPKAPGWDKEDEYLERAAKHKREEQKSWFKAVPGSAQVQCRCASCKYVFKYDPVKNMPKACPYCDGPIPRFNQNMV